MPDAFVFQAAMLCTDCAQDVMDNTPAPHGVDPTAPDESLYDSDDWPKGPYPDGGGEADTPQHCDHCGAFLENPLTDDGDSYVRAAARPYDGPDSSWDEIALAAEDDGQHVLGEWIRHYFAWGQ